MNDQYYRSVHPNPAENNKMRWPKVYSLSLYIYIYIYHINISESYPQIQTYSPSHPIRPQEKTVYYIKVTLMSQKSHRSPAKWGKFRVHVISII
jgi:hypothetical protein